MDENDALGTRTDKCISGLMYNSAGGLLTGAIFSFLLFKRKTWPMFVGTGVGTGIAASNCRQAFRQEIDDAVEAVGLGCDLPEMFAKTKAALGKK